MKKDQQVSINDFVMQNYNRMMDELIAKKSYDGVQLRSCKACVYETENFFILRSYEHVVAFIDKLTGEKFDVLR